MFIKILTPNHNGKIELTVRDLEALINEAVDKAIREDRANRPYRWADYATLSTTNPCINTITGTNGTSGIRYNPPDVTGQTVRTTVTANAEGVC